MSMKSLFLRQSSQDAWDYYESTLKNPALNRWDYVLLTASDEKQAMSYEMQLEARRKAGRLPSGTHFAALPDAGGKRVGSGGATFGALRYVYEGEGGFAGKRVLVIHSGGDSRRVPQYSACGKLFSPVPRLLPDGRRSTLFDEFLIGLSAVPSRVRDGMLVCSGDVLLLFNPLQLDFYGRGAAALSIKECAQTGKDHGVYRIDADGNVGRFLHKQSLETLGQAGAIDSRGDVDIDTGAVLLDTSIMKDLYALVDTQKKFDLFVNSNARVSFYADFLYPMASESTLEQFYLEKPEGEYTTELRACRTALWDVLSKYRMKLIRFAPASFIHFGTTSELLFLMTKGISEYQYLDWQHTVHANREIAGVSASNSVLEIGAHVGAGTYIEDSIVGADAVVGQNCVISGVTIRGATVPDDTVVHGLKLDDGRFSARVYGVRDNPKESLWLGKSIPEPLWTYPAHPVYDTMEEAVRVALTGREAERVSLAAGFARADVQAVQPWREHLADMVRVERFANAVDDRSTDETSAIFPDGVSERAKEMLLDAAKRADFARRMRILYHLSGVCDYPERDRLAAQAFDAIRDAVLVGAEESAVYDGSLRIAQEETLVRLPVRVNWGGGWTDTPPHCLERGGTVLNAAVSIRGILPVEAVVRAIPERKIILESGDNDSYGEFTDVRTLQQCANPSDPFALHKAGLIACGIIPYRENADLEAILKQLGGGFRLSTQVTGIPRGSGLGTSSILAGACAKALGIFTGAKIDENALYSRVLCMEQIMSTGGGWQDQAGGLTNGIKMITSAPGLRQRIVAIPVRISDTTLKELNTRFCLIYTGQRRLARNLLRDVVGRYIGNQSDALSALADMRTLAERMKEALERGHINTFAQLLNEHWAASQRLDHGCTNTCIDCIFLSIGDMIDGRMICGAGGGGFLQVILKDGVTKEALAHRVQDVFGDAGVMVWESAFV